MRVVDVVPRAIREDRVDEVGLDLWRHRPLGANPRASFPGDSSSKSHPIRWPSTYPLMSIDDASTGLGSAAPRRTTPYSVSIPHTLAIAILSLGLALSA